jgi:predicted  nucleic acid-binding Zn-ribbon protein
MNRVGTSLAILAALGFLTALWPLRSSIRTSAREIAELRASQIALSQQVRQLQEELQKKSPNPASVSPVPSTARESRAYADLQGSLRQLQGRIQQLENSNLTNKTFVEEKLVYPDSIRKSNYS